MSKVIIDKEKHDNRTYAAGNGAVGDACRTNRMARFVGIVALVLVALAGGVILVPNSAFASLRQPILANGDDVVRRGRSAFSCGPRRRCASPKDVRVARLYASGLPLWFRRCR